MITQDKYRDGRSDIDLRRHLREPSAFMRTRPDDEDGEFAMNYEDGEVCGSQTGLSYGSQTVSYHGEFAMVTKMERFVKVRGIFSLWCW